MNKSKGILNNNRIGAWSMCFDLQTCGHLFFHQGDIICTQVWSCVRDPWTCFVRWQLERWGTLHVIYHNLILYHKKSEVIFPYTKCSDFVLLSPSLFLNVYILCIFESEIWKLKIENKLKCQNVHILITSFKIRHWITGI